MSRSAVAIRASGIAVVVVESCESGFLRRALNNGLPVMTCPGIAAAVRDGDVISADPATGAVTLADGRVLRSKPFSERMVQIWRAGGDDPAARTRIRRAARRRARHRETPHDADPSRAARAPPRWPHRRIARAQGFPDRPVRVMVPFPPGGNVDFTARLLAPATARPRSASR